MPCMNYWSGKLPHLKSKKFNNSKLRNKRLGTFNAYQSNSFQAL